MDSLLFIIVLFFIAAGLGYGIGAKTYTSANDVIAAVTKTFASLGGLVLMLLMVAQFIAYFNYSNMPTVIAVALADLLERAAVPPILLLVGFILVIVLLDFIIPGVIPKWAIFAPVFIPIFLRLGIGAADRARRLSRRRFATQRPHAADGLLPLHRDRGAALHNATRASAPSSRCMLPYAVIMLVAWILLVRDLVRARHSARAGLSRPLNPLAGNVEFGDVWLRWRTRKERRA